MDERSDIDTDRRDPEKIPLPPLFEDAKRLGFAELHRRLEAEGHPKLRHAHGCVFRYIDDEGSRLTDLAAQSGLTKQAVGEFVDDLERLEYVERIPDPLDGRAKLIRLTSRGAEGTRSALRIFDEIEREWAERFGADRVAILREVLEEIVAAESAGAADDRGLVTAR
ncbi:MAG: MarR family winged helix-turn-helix transcriptional regulator [Solirubrobacterales bacterium]